MPQQQRIGGTFAPPLSAGQLENYQALADGASPKIKEAMGKLAVMLETFWETPESQRAGSPHPSGTGIIVPLEQAEVDRIWDVVPWQEELDLFAQWFESISPTEQPELRNAAFHLLWFGRELYLDREPMTSDKL